MSFAEFDTHRQFVELPQDVFPMLRTAAARSRYFSTADCLMAISGVISFEN
jgi:hypothetical protein